METFDAIRSRHSIGKVKPDELPRETIQTLLEAGNQAPNHHKARPWRFFVLTGAALGRLGGAMADSQRARKPDLPPENYEKTRLLPLRAPLIVAVGVDKPATEKIIEIENVCAAAAACQNILLAAHALGLGAIWRTGEYARDAKVKEFFGLAPDQHLIAFIYVGYPEGETMLTERPPVDERVTWME